jgi:hypothetical protein
VLLTASMSHALFVTVVIDVLIDVEPTPALLEADASGGCCFTFQ